LLCPPPPPPPPFSGWHGSVSRSCWHTDTCVVGAGGTPMWRAFGPRSGRAAAPRGSPARVRWAARQNGPGNPRARTLRGALTRTTGGGTANGQHSTGGTLRLLLPRILLRDAILCAPSATPAAAAAPTSAHSCGPARAAPQRWPTPSACGEDSCKVMSAIASFWTCWGTWCATRPTLRSPRQRTPSMVRQGSTDPNPTPPHMPSRACALVPISAVLTRRPPAVARCRAARCRCGRAVRSR